jgi:hypothetical protein
MVRIFLLIGFFCLMEVHGQLKDSAIRRYFVMESRGPLALHKIIKDGRRIWVRDTFRNSMRGKLRILNDTTIEIHNLFTREKDTFDVRAINKVKRPTLAGTLISIHYGIQGVALFVAGVALITYGDEWVRRIGYFVTGAGTLTAVASFSSVNGSSSRRENYKFRIINTRGFKLKRKYVKYL